MLLCGVSHIYDLAALTPLFVAFWRHVRKRKTMTIVAVSLMFAMFFSQSLLIPFHLDWLLQIRVPILLGSLMWLLVMSYRQATQQPQKLRFQRSEAE